MSDLIRKVTLPADSSADPARLEWLVTNGLGGYAAGTVSGVLTRRFHGILVAALPAPFGRTMMLNDLSEQLRLADGSVVRLGGQHIGDISGGAQVSPHLKEFRLEEGLPVWRYEVAGYVLERRVLMIHLQNTAHVSYSLLEGEGAVRLELRPALHFRPHEGAVAGQIQEPYVLTVKEDCFEVCAMPKLPPLRLILMGDDGAFTFNRKVVPNIIYQVERNRGYDFEGELWSPGYFHAELSRSASATLIASTEAWENIKALAPPVALNAERERRGLLLEWAHPDAQSGMGAEMVLAADQFIITPAGRVEDAMRAHAAGDECRTVIAGYHWFTDWGRDTMISLEGLTLVTRRHAEAGWILRTFAYYVRDGLIPNMFPEGENLGLYHTTDATLWFFHAISRYVEITQDRATLRLILPKLMDIVQHHIRGTRFGIGVDPADGLLTQGQEGYQLTWMDAKVDGWVVTPRRGKAVEINALWYNALRLLAGWVRDEQGEAAAEIDKHAERARDSFNRRFWYEAGGYLYDVIDGEEGDDTACRPNQIFAISLEHPVLDRQRWESVLNVVSNRLLTPVGLRSLAPDHPQYKPKYDGDLRSRDAAYHQGTVWAWLIGPFVDAWLKVHPEDRGGARHFLEGFISHLGEACVGTISEIFDAEPPYMPRGCAAQAWSVAEVLRCWVKTGSRIQDSGAGATTLPSSLNPES